MAIQLPNPGLGDGQTGDNEFVMWTKVKDNFNNSTHAASRLVATTVGVRQQPENDKVVTWVGKSIGGYGLGGQADIIGQIRNLWLNQNDLATGFYYAPSDYYTNSAAQGATAALPAPANSYVINVNANTSAGFSAQIVMPQGSAGMYYRAVASGGVGSNWVKVYDTQNTTRDTATGFLKASSPVLHVYNDSITKIHEAEQLDIEVDKKGVGHYEIHGTTGLRKNDGWFMSPPRDVHGNVLCMVDLEEKDGVVILRTYKKKFDFETVAIVHDWDNPMDIPEGVCVEFRFNDIPQEQIDEPIE